MAIRFLLHGARLKVWMESVSFEPTVWNENLTTMAIIDMIIFQKVGFTWTIRWYSIPVADDELIGQW